MDSLDLKFYSEDQHFQCAISAANSIREDQEQEKMDGGDLIIVSHVNFEPDTMAGESALESMLCGHDLQIGETSELNGRSTLENLLTAVFVAGVKYARGERNKLQISDI